MACPPDWGVYTGITDGDITAPQDGTGCCPSSEVVCTAAQANDQDSRYYLDD